MRKKLRLGTTFMTNIALPPRFNNEEVQKFISQNFFLHETVIENISSYDDQNFIVRDLTHDQKFIFKISNLNESISLIEAQNAMMTYLDKHAALTCSVPIKNRQKMFITYMNDHKNNSYICRLLTFVDGIFLGEDRKLLKNNMNLITKKIANLSQVLEQFDHPGCQREFHWDLLQADQGLEYISHISDIEARRFAYKHLYEFKHLVKDRLKKFRKSVIHGDLNDHNILLQNPQTEAPQLGLIDFGDTVYSHTIFDFAIFAAYMLLECDNLVSALTKMTGSYHAIFPLEEQECKILPRLICARLSFSLAHSSLQGQFSDDPEYICVSQKPIIHILKKISQIDLEHLGARLASACGYTVHNYENIIKNQMLEKRKKVLPQCYSTSYKDPIHLRYGSFQYLFDRDGKTYLDCINNINHIGHCHPIVNEAIYKTSLKYNINSRFLYDELNELGEKLLAKFPASLNNVFFLNSGSEANELALRLGRNFTDSEKIICFDGAYHGNTSKLIQISSYKFWQKRIEMSHPNVIRLPIPLSPEQNELTQTEDIKSFTSKCLSIIEQEDLNGGCFIFEPIMSCAGQIKLPSETLKVIIAKLREKNFFIIADEIQTGFGRCGSHFWAFESHSIEPDIVTLGKSMGNGVPISAVVTNNQIANCFKDSKEFFSSYGGNALSCAAANAVLTILEEDKLQNHIQTESEYLRKNINQITIEKNIMQEIRGQGFFLGFRIDTEMKCHEIVEKAKVKGILLSQDGINKNIIKFKPPVIFSRTNSDFLCDFFNDL